MSFLAFVVSRIETGRLLPASLGRANRALRRLPKERRLDLAARGASFRIPPPGLPLSVDPVSWDVACAMVNVEHRHHGAPVGHLFSLGVFAGEDLVGVAICGRPVARMLDTGSTLEVTRTVSVGYQNAISKVLGAVKREAVLRGYSKVITYTLPSENGASLKASGFTCAGTAGGGSWSRAGRERDDKHPTEEKQRWEWLAPNKYAVKIQSAQQMRQVR